MCKTAMKEILLTKGMLNNIQYYYTCYNFNWDKAWVWTAMSMEVPAMQTVSLAWYGYYITVPSWANERAK